MTYLAYEYGCQQPVKGAADAIEQMWRRNRFWNMLVEIDHRHRAHATGLINHEVPEQAALEILLTARDALRLEMKARRKAARKRGVDLKELKDQVDVISLKIREAIPAAKQARKESIARNREALKADDDLRKIEVKKHCAESGLYWCNYDDVITSYDVARIRAMKEGRELRFHGWRGEGKISIRYQTGLPAQNVFVDDTRLQINPVDPAAWDLTHTRRSMRRKLARTRIRLRVGSNPDRSPIWLELPMIMHRGLPEQGMIRQACARRERVGDRYRWKVVLVVALAEDPAPRLGPAIGIDVGWRKMPNGSLRVAYWADETGSYGEIVLPDTVVSQFEQVRNLQSIIDQHFELAKTRLGEWQKKQNELPDWLRTALETLGQWRGPKRMMRLYWQWMPLRFEGDGEAIEILSAFRERYEHLYPWQANLRDQIIARRREIYRIAVSQILKTHGRIFIEEFDLRGVIRKPQPEQAARETSDRSRFIASTAALSTMLVLKGQAQKMPAEFTTQQCSWCGHQQMEPWDAAESILHRCIGCGRIWDQDHNAARNILARGLAGTEEQKSDPRNLEGQSNAQAL